MKAQVKVNPTTIVEVEAETQKDLFREVASAHEIFGEKVCGLCGCERIVPHWRTATRVTGKKSETFEYSEWRCTNQDCRARLSLGVMNDGSDRLFPNRKLTAEGKPSLEGSYGEHQGWSRYRGEKVEDAKG